MVYSPPVWDAVCDWMQRDEPCLADVEPQRRCSLFDFEPYRSGGGRHDNRRIGLHPARPYHIESSRTWAPQGNVPGPSSEVSAVSVGGLHRAA